MELLLFLLEHRGELITRDQIVEKIWGKGVFLDTDNSINGAIRKIRQVLRHNPDEPRFVQTIPGKGYRFIAPVIEAEEKVGTGNSGGAQTASEAGAEGGRGIRWGWFATEMPRRWSGKQLWGRKSLERQTGFPITKRSSWPTRVTCKRPGGWLNKPWIWRSRLANGNERQPTKPGKRCGKPFSETYRPQDGTPGQHWKCQKRATWSMESPWP